MYFSHTSVIQSNMPVVKTRGDKENKSGPSNQPRATRATSRGKHKRRGSRVEQYRTLYGDTDLKPHEGRKGGEEGSGGIRGLNQQKMVSILKAYGEYPAKYRVFIWQSLLQLPGNHTAYSTLLERGTHPAYTNLHRDYPIKSQRLGRVLQRYIHV